MMNRRAMMRRAQAVYAAQSRLSSTSFALCILLLVGCRRPGAAPSVRAAPAEVEIWFRNVHLVDTDRGVIQRDRALGIAGGTIRAIVAANHVPLGTSAQVIDAGGTYAIPGLWDSHVHLLQDNEATAERHAAHALALGITHVRDMGSSLDARTTFLTRLGQPGMDAPMLIGAGPTFWAFALPYGDKQQQVIVTDPADTDAAVDRVADRGVDFIKVYAGFDRTRLPQLVAAARRRGLTVAGHSQPDMTLAEHAKFGVSTVEHLDFGTLAECTTDADSYFERVIAARFRNSGESVPAIYADFADRVDTADCRARLRRAADAGLVLTPTLVASYLSAVAGRALLARMPESQREGCALYLRQFDGLSDAAQAALPEAGQRLMRMVIDAGMPVLAGTDAPAFCTLPGESLAIELQMFADAGLPLLSVLQSATSTPARLFGESDRFGTLTIGRTADLVLLRANPLETTSAYVDPVGVFTHGRWRDAVALAALRRR